jgi:UDP-N-acetylmuramate--alanine ligase
LPGNVWVAEVDESDKSLLQFDPRWALITTITADHWPLEETRELFRVFAARVSDTIVCGPGVIEQLKGDPRVRARLLEVCEGVEVSLPGEHNRINAACVLKMAEVCGADPLAARMALQSFRGIERRLELCSGAGIGPRVYDDYAHNPEKLAAAMCAVRPQKGKLIALWRPHGFTPLRQNFEALADAFAGALRPGDEAWILPVFYAGGSASKGIEGADLAKAICARGGKGVALETYPQKVDLDAEDVLLVMGARDPELPRFAARIGRAVG